MDSPDLAEDEVVKPFRHRPLAKIDKEIRLISLERIRWTYSTSRDKPLRCKMVHVSLEDNPEYQTLSYAWGTSGFTRYIDICMDENPPQDWERFRITESLELALKRIRSGGRDGSNVHLKRPLRECLLWVDAICIDQRDDVEKGHQVKLMAQIYSKSSRLLVWLGNPVDVDEEVRSDRYMQSSSHWYAYTRDSKRVEQLLSLPWFKRRWCVQEVLRAQRGTIFVMFGEELLSQPEFNELVSSAQYWEHAGVFRWSHDRRTYHCLLENLQALAAYECRNKLDLVYSLLSVSADNALASRPIWPDYGINVDLMFRQVAERYCTNEFLVALLACASTRNDLRPTLQGRTVDSLMPSWVPDWRQQSVYHSAEHRWSLGLLHFCLPQKSHDDSSALPFP